MLGAGRQQQQPRRADRVGRQHHDLGRLEVLVAVAVDPGGAGGQPVGVGLDASNSGAGDQSGAHGDRLGPVGLVGRGLGALVAARLAGAALDARPAAVVGRRVDRVELRPPVPAQLGVGAGHLQPGRADGQRRHRRVFPVRRIGRIAGQADDAEVAVSPVEVGQQLEVVDRPVVGDAVEAAHAEVAGQGARPGAGKDQRRAADAVVHERLDRRCRPRSTG